MEGEVGDIAEAIRVHGGNICYGIPYLSRKIQGNMGLALDIPCKLAYKERR